jgi:hypothetical protein
MEALCSLLPGGQPGARGSEGAGEGDTPETAPMAVPGVRVRLGSERYRSPSSSTSLAVSTGTAMAVGPWPRAFTTV